LRLDDSGAVSWATDVSSGTQDAEINGVATLPNGSFAVAGAQDSSVWMVGLDSKGSVTWSHEDGGSGDERVGGMLEYHGLGRPLLSRSDGSLVAAGTSSSFGNDYDGWLLQTTPNGNVGFAATSVAQQTDPSGGYPPAPIVTADTQVVRAPATLALADVEVAALSTDASTLTQAP
jgi:hypothetical protein